MVLVFNKKLRLNNKLKGNVMYHSCISNPDFLRQTFEVSSTVCANRPHFNLKWAINQNGALEHEIIACDASTRTEQTFIRLLLNLVYFPPPCHSRSVKSIFLALADRSFGRSAAYK